tara:strand:+ start:75 stop:305 length:231 start_codon:yes stop_codon:yes gene_type:complete
MKSLKQKGNLVYVPSETYLKKIKDDVAPDHAAVHQVVCLQDPKYLLVHEEKQTYLSVIMDGEIWYVDKRKVYEVRK